MSHWRKLRAAVPMVAAVSGCDSGARDADPATTKPVGIVRAFTRLAADFPALNTTKWQVSDTGVSMAAHLRGTNESDWRRTAIAQITALATIRNRCTTTPGTGAIRG